MATGVQCVMMAGMLGMLPQRVSNWDTVTLVTIELLVYDDSSLMLHSTI